MGSLGFFVDLILPAALWPRGGLDRNERKGYRVTGGRFVGLTTLPPSRADSENSGSVNLLEPQGLVQACIGIAFCKNVLKTGTP